MNLAWQFGSVRAMYFPMDNGMVVSASPCQRYIFMLMFSSRKPQGRVNTTNSQDNPSTPLRQASSRSARFMARISGRANTSLSTWGADDGRYFDTAAGSRWTMLTAGAMIRRINHHGGRLAMPRTMRFERSIPKFTPG